MSLPVFDIETEETDYLRDVIRLNSHGNITMQQALKLLLIKPKTMFQQTMQFTMQQNKDIINPQILQNATPNDFRAVMREILESEIGEGHIQRSIQQLREEGADPKTYNQVLQQWAKFTYPEQKQVDINIDIQQKRDMYDEMFEQYGNSTQIEDAEIYEEDPLAALPAPSEEPSIPADDYDAQYASQAELDPMASFVQHPKHNSAPVSFDNNPVSFDNNPADIPPSSTFDSVFSPAEETTTPAPASSNTSPDESSDYQEPPY